MQRVVFSLFVCCALFMSPCLSAHAGINMGGSVAYKISGEELTLWVEQVSNDNLLTNSGTLKLKLTATVEPYSGGSMNGYVLGTYELGTLRALNSFNDIEAAVTYSSPPAGSYFITVTLTEWNGSNDVIVDYVSLGGETLGKTVAVKEEDGGGGCFIMTSGY